MLVASAPANQQKFWSLDTRIKQVVLLVPLYWPLMVDMLPCFVDKILRRFHDYLATVLAAAGALEVRGPPGVPFLMTSNPANMRHIFVSSFANYHKGEEFASCLVQRDGRQLLLLEYPNLLHMLIVTGADSICDRHV
jgi:hypothetical protein